MLFVNILFLFTSHQLSCFFVVFKVQLFAFCFSFFKEECFVFCLSVFVFCVSFCLYHTNSLVFCFFLRAVLYLLFVFQYAS